MNARILSILFCLVFTALTSITVSAADWRFGGNIGAAWWHPEWEHDLTGFDSETLGIYGPSLFLRTGPIGLGVQYYTGSFDIKFHNDTHEYRTDRTDLDLMLSYRFLSFFHVSALYKKIEFDWHQTFHVETSIDGFGLGAGASRMLFQDQLLLYGYGFYMPKLDYSQRIASSGSVASDADGYWIEAGAGWYLRVIHTMIKAGFRRQVISVEGSSMDWNETTQGPRVELSYVF